MFPSSPTLGHVNAVLASDSAIEADLLSGALGIVTCEHEPATKMKKTGESYLHLATLTIQAEPL